MRALLACLVLAACQKTPAALPAWAELPPAGAAIRGDATLGGAPAQVPKLAHPPTLDGKLDDWTGGAVLGPFVEPGAGGDAAGSPVAGFARVGWDDQNLYVAFVVHDREPRSPFARDAVDPHIWAEASGVEIMLQPGDPHDNQDYVELQVDPNGAVWDTRFDDYNAPVAGEGAARTFGHQDWDAHLGRAIHVADGQFWSVEIALPWSSLPRGRAAIPPRPGDVWRLNLYTFRDGQRKALAWSPLKGQGNFHKASRFGRIVFTL